MSDYDDLLDRLDAPTAEGWKPEPGEKLAGEVVEVSTGNSEYGEYPLVVVRTQDGSEKAIHGFRTVLKNELDTQRPQAGDAIAVKYLGEVPGKSGNAYHSYRVVVKRGANHVAQAAPVAPVPEAKAAAQQSDDDLFG